MRRWRRESAMAAARVGRDAGETEEEKTAAGIRHIYDRWVPRFPLTPVDPTLRVWTPVDCIGAVHPRLQQKII